MRREGALFRDRLDAGRQLAERLEGYRLVSPAVFAIPRGGVPIAAVIAEHLGADLDVVATRKLGAPLYPELAIGAVTADGEMFLNVPLLRQLRVDRPHLEQVARKESAEAQRQEAQFRSGRPGVDPRDHTVLLVDDGLATGATMRAAVRSLRKRGPRRIIVAVPVGSRQAPAELHDEADEVICLATPEPFHAVGMYYDLFDQVDDATVKQLLASADARSAKASSAPTSHGEAGR
jgi:predicted phosphoribosyltransferase